MLDTWFSSGLWPFSTLGWPEQTPELKRYYPGDVLVTGFDIIFFWVARMMMQGLHFMGDVPFRTVYIHALVRDERGQKMSKSRGNIIDPLDLIDRYGCDALRFTLAALASPGRDIKLAESRVESSRNFATKLWNAARYAEMSGCALQTPGFDPRGCRLTVNRWIAGATRDCAVAVTTALETFRFDEAAHRLYHFAWGTFCDWYLEFTKPILQGEDEAARAETQATTAWVLAQLVHLLHPVMPFITEELWRQLAGERGRNADPGGLARSAARIARPRGRGRDGLGRRGDHRDPRDPHRGQRAGRRRACRCWSRMPMPRRRRGSIAIASTSSASPGSSGSRRSRPCRRAGSPAVVEGTTLILRIGDVIDLAQGEGAARARRSAGSTPI